jgi:ferredoxin--NADP+ reductase
MTAVLAPNATLIERIDVAPALAIFRVRPDAIPQDGGPWFVPGQYVTLGIGDLQRAYSIASEPAERRWLEFYIRYARNPETETPLTHKLFDLEVGGRLHAGERIVGRFTLARTLPAGDTRWRVFIAAGTGLAPFVSMVRAAVRDGDAAALGRTAVLHGASRPDEFAYAAELTAAAERFGLRYIPTLSRPLEHPEWTGRVGRVEYLLRSDLGLPLAPESAIAYVCGFRGTIAESVRALLRRGFAPEDRRLRRLLGLPDTKAASLFFEQYDLEPVFDPNDAAVIASLRAELPPA